MLRTRWLRNSAGTVRPFPTPLVEFLILGPLCSRESDNCTANVIMPITIELSVSIHFRLPAVDELATNLSAIPDVAQVEVRESLPEAPPSPGGWLEIMLTIKPYAVGTALYLGEKVLEAIIAAVVDHVKNRTKPNEYVSRRVRLLDEHGRQLREIQVDPPKDPNGIVF